MSDETASCPSGRITTGSIVIIVGVLSIVANCIAVSKCGHSRVRKTTVVSLKILCGASIVQAAMTTICTCLTTFTCSLDNSVACVLQGALQRLVRVIVHLSFTMFFKNSLFHTTTRPSRSMVKIVQIVLTIAWLIIAVVSSLPLFASTSYRHYPSLFACDIADMSVLVTSDSFVFCVPALAVLAMGLCKIASGSSHSLEHRISYVVNTGRMNIQPHEDLQKMKREAEAAVVISTALFLEWTVRIAAVLGTANSSKHLLTLSLFFMLTCALCAPSCLLLVSRFPVTHISTQEGCGSRRCSPQDNFTFSPHMADLQSVPSSPEVNLRPADLRLNGDLYRRCAMHARDRPNTPPGQDLPNLPNSPIWWRHPNGRDLGMSPLELHLLQTPPGQLIQDKPLERDLLNSLTGQDPTSISGPRGQGGTSTPLGRRGTSTPLGRDLQNTPQAWDLPNTSPGRDLQNTSQAWNLPNTSPGLDLQNTPHASDLPNTLPGRDFQNTTDAWDVPNTSTGRDLLNTPPVRDCQNSSLELDVQDASLEEDLENITPNVTVTAGSLSPPVTPDLALKRNSVSCQFSVGSWITNEHRRTSSAWLRVHSNMMTKSCPDVSEDSEETGTCHSKEA